MEWDPASPLRGDLTGFILSQSNMVIASLCWCVIIAMSEFCQQEYAPVVLERDVTQGKRSLAGWQSLECDLRVHGDDYFWSRCREVRNPFGPVSLAQSHTCENGRKTGNIGAHV